MARHAGVAGGFAVADEDRPHMRHLSEYLAMRAKAREAQRFVVGLGVDQHQIGLDVAIAVARPIAAQIMVAVFGIKRRVARSLWEDHQAMGRCALTGRGVPWHGCEPLRFSERPRKWQSCRSEEHTSELQSLMRITYAVYCLNKKKIHNPKTRPQNITSNRKQIKCITYRV